MVVSSLSMYQSSGQTFTQRGRPGRQGYTSMQDMNDFDGAIEDLRALSARLLVVHRESAVALADALTFNTKEAIRRHMPRGSWRPGDVTTGEPFEFSQGRLHAAWGIYTPESMGAAVTINNESLVDKHEEWAFANGVADASTEGRDMGEETSIEMGALTELKRVKSNVWSAETGTFLPYAGLANDGGTMMIYPYGNRAAEPVEAHWEGVHFVEEGVAMTEAQIPGIVEGSIQSALDAQTGRRTVRNPRPRRSRRRA